MIEVQTRSEDTGINIHKSFEAAFKNAEEDPSIWKISFSLSNGERVRLVRQILAKESGNETQWVYEPIEVYLKS